MWRTGGVGGKKENVEPKSKITLTDKISYKGLTRGEKYTAKGVLMDQASGKSVLDASGKEITAEKEFTALLGSGSVKVNFTFDATSLYGKETVVFEKVYDAQGRIAAKHEDINDEGQTVTWEKPSIGTKLTGEKGAKTVAASKKTQLTDTVSYKGLDTSQWYVIEGTLMVKDTGDPLVENGHEILVRSEPFKPNSPNGETQVNFIIDTTKLDGKELVAFETAYRLEDFKGGTDITGIPMTVVAEHKDLKDKGQTIKVEKTPEKSAPPKTGDDNRLMLWFALMGFGLIGGTGFAVKEGMRSLRQRKEDMDLLV